MNIALVNASFSVIGGVEQITLGLASDLLRRGHGVRIFTSEIAGEGIPGPLRDRMTALHVGGLFSSFLDWRRAGKKIRPLLKDFDCVHCQNFPGSAWLHYAFEGQANHPPVLVFFHEPPAHLYGGQALKPDYKNKGAYLRGRIRSDRFRAVPAALQKSVFYTLQALFPERLKKYHQKIDRAAVLSAGRRLTTSHFIREKLLKIYGLEFEVCHQGLEVPETIEAAEAGDYILTVGRLEPQKNTETLLQALKLLADRGACKNLKLKIVGTGTEAVRLQALSRTYGLEERVQFLGFIARQTLWELYAGAAMVAVIPFNEPLGLVPIEAMLAGAPVIASSEGGMRETVVHGETGLSVDPRDPEKVAASIERLYRDTTLRRRLAEEGGRRVQTRYTFEGFVTRMETIYRNLVERGA
jgi:glycosyltransferase involved in cell wall biosynthesis